MHLFWTNHLGPVPYSTKVASIHTIVDDYWENSFHSSYVYGPRVATKTQACNCNDMMCRIYVSCHFADDLDIFHWQLDGRFRIAAEGHRIPWTASRNYLPLSLLSLPWVSLKATLRRVLTCSRLVALSATPLRLVALTRVSYSSFFF